MVFEVKKAKRQRRPLKINLEGVSGSGKTYSALRLAFAMRRAGIGKRIVVADSENESAGLYDGVVCDGERWEYDVCPMPHDKQNPAGYAAAYEYLVGQGFDIIIGDSLTHAWYGAQEMVDAHAAANRGDKFGGWAKVTPQQRAMLATLTDGRAHFISTMRVKSEYEKRLNERTGKEQMTKVGTKTDQREGAEYEFDVVVRMDRGDVPTDHVITVEKVRGCTAMDGRRGVNPGPDFWKPLFDWWLSAEVIVTPVEKLSIDLRKAVIPAEWDAACVAVRSAWPTLSERDRKTLVDLKAELATRHAVTIPPPAAIQPQSPPVLITSPGEGTGLPPDDDAARDDFVGRLNYACEQLGTTGVKLLARHHLRIGGDASRPPGRPEDLTMTQLEHLTRLAEDDANRESGGLLFPRGEGPASVMKH